MKKFALLLVCVMLAGCAAKVVSTSPRTVVVKAMRHDYAGAQKLADAQCAEHKRFARMIERPGLYTAEFTFDCVN
jgi:hypothetical protein